MNAQDAWCFKAKAAASTGDLSLLESEDFPSDIELDVIVGMLRVMNALMTRCSSRRCKR